MVKPVGAPKRTRTTKIAGPPSKRSRTARNAVPLPLTTLQDLNDDCLVHIFRLLDIISLLKVCKMCQRFKDIVLQRVIPSKTFDFSTFSKCHSVRKVLKVFGKAMTRIVIHGDDIQMTHPKTSRFDEFLLLILEYGEPGKLRQVTMHFAGGEFWPRRTATELHDAVLPYFKNVHTMDIISTDYYWSLDKEFFSKMPKQNLRSLSLHNVCVGNWLTAESLPNLQSFHLCSNKQWGPFGWHGDNSNVNVMRYITSKPASLVDFDCVGVSHGAFFVELSLSCPNIERLGEIMCWPERRVNNHDHHHQHHHHNHNDNNNNNEASVVVNYREKWKYLDAFTNLKYSRLSSHEGDFSDCGEAFRILAKRNTIEELELNFEHHRRHSNGNHSSRVSNEHLKRLNKLKTIHLNSIEEGSNEFINHLFSDLPVLTKCTLSGGRFNQSGIHRAVQMAPNLRVLVLKCKVVFTVPLYKKLLKIRRAVLQNPEETRLVIHVEAAKAASCLEGLGKKYKPSIIAIKSI